MAYDERLAERLHYLLQGEPGVGDLMVRADPDAAAEWVDYTVVRLMEMRGRELKGWLLVAPDALIEDQDLQVWVDRGVAFARSLS